MAKTPKVEFHPDPEQLALMPDLSGNEINGQGETEFRRPTRVYWHNPKDIPHGGIQKWMVDKFNRVEDFKTVYSEGDRGPLKLDPVAGLQQEDSAANWVAKVKELALQYEADLVGITALNPDWTYDDCGPDVAPWIIILGVEMNHARLAQAPSSDTDTASALEVSVQYNRGARAAAHLANWIRSQGYNSESHAGPWAGPMTLTPAALACGFGVIALPTYPVGKMRGSTGTPVVLYRNLQR